MNREKLKIAVENDYIEWEKHALERMMEREISRETVKKILLTGEVIEDYLDDKPFPSALFSGWIEDEPFHVVSALDSVNGYCYVITAYKPDLEHFESDYKTRRQDG
ncbi:MAG: DUF4258 domain-containing protein [bacterium]